MLQYINPLNSTSGIYIIKNSNGYYYYGSSKNLRLRYNHHCKQLLDNKHCNQHMQRRFLKEPNGWLFEIVESVDCTLLKVTEQRYLNMHYGQTLCMNINPSADRMIYTNEIRKLISESRKRTGVKPPSRKGSTWSAETRLKMKGNKPPLYGMKGKLHSLETKQKMSEARKLYYINLRKSQTDLNTSGAVKYASGS